MINIITTSTLNENDEIVKTLKQFSFFEHINFFEIENGKLTPEISQEHLQNYWLILRPSTIINQEFKNILNFNGTEKFLIINNWCVFNERITLSAVANLEMHNYANYSFQNRFLINDKSCCLVKSDSADEVNAIFSSNAEYISRLCNVKIGEFKFFPDTMMKETPLTFFDAGDIESFTNYFEQCKNILQEKKDSSNVLCFLWLNLLKGYYFSGLNIFSFNKKKYKFLRQQLQSQFPLNYFVYLTTLDSSYYSDYQLSKNEKKCLMIVYNFDYFYVILLWIKISFLFDFSKDKFKYFHKLLHAFLSVLKYTLLLPYFLLRLLFFLPRDTMHLFKAIKSKIRSNKKCK